MGLFGNKDKDNKKLNNDAVDDKLLAAIDQAEAQMEQERQDKIAERQKAREDEVNKLKVAKEEIIKRLPNEGRRAYMMVTECIEAEETYVKVKGRLVGEAKVNDTLYIYRPGGTIIESKITVLAPVAEEIAESDVPETVEFVKNCPVVVTLAVDALEIRVAPQNVAPFASVISSIKPQDSIDLRLPAENPALLGLSFCYNDYKTDKKYLDALFRHIINGTFIVPAHVDESVKNEKGEPSRKIIMVKNKQDALVLPVFTDFPTLTKWKELFADGAKPTIVLMKFPDIVKFTEKDSLNFIINPMGPIGIEIPHSIIKDITATKGYQQQFVEKAKYTKETIGDEAKRIAVGEVPYSPETKAIKSALKSFGSTHKEVNSIGLLAMRRGGTNCYLVVVDCDKSVAREVFRDIKAACTPHMIAIKEMNFSLYAETMFADRWFADHAFEYVKNPNA